MKKFLFVVGLLALVVIVASKKEDNCEKPGPAPKVKE